VSRWLSADRALQDIESERVHAYGLDAIFGQPERRELTEEQKREAEGWQQRHDDANYRRKLRKREIDAERKVDG